MTLKTQRLGSFAENTLVCTTKVRDEPSRNGKRYEDKAYCPPPKVWEDVFQLGLGTQPCYQAPGDLGVKLVSNAVINIRLVTLPFNSGPKLAVGQ